MLERDVRILVFLRGRRREPFLRRLVALAADAVLRRAPLAALLRGAADAVLRGVADAVLRGVDLRALGSFR